mgnify:CR=1 FL=1
MSLVRKYGLAIIIVIGFISNIRGQSDWSATVPFPQGQSLNSVHLFNEQKMILAGHTAALSTLLRMVVLPGPGRCSIMVLTSMPFTLLILTMDGLPVLMAVCTKVQMAVQAGRSASRALIIHFIPFSLQMIRLVGQQAYWG